MATSVSRIHAQIAKLQQQADALKQAAVKRVQREIELHSLTSEDLFGGGTSVGGGRNPKAVKAIRAKSKTAKAPKYGDSSGNTWGGMGKRPLWLKDALEAGSSLEQFLLSNVASKAKAGSTAKQKAKRSSQAPAKKTAKRQAAAKKVIARKPVRKTASTAASSD